MDDAGKSTRLWRDFFKLNLVPIRAFHMSWMAFFLCFFAWFGIAPLMPTVRAELGLSPSQIALSAMAAVGVTVLARLLVGWLCDRIGPRWTYSGLLVVGAFPVMAIGLANDPATFILCRLMIGVIGASFVITQYHTSVMFAPNVVGAANATSAGWGNLGGGVTQFAMPMLFLLLVSVMGLPGYLGWRAAMFAAGAVCALAGAAYFLLTQDTPQGSLAELRAAGKLPPPKEAGSGFLQAACDYRVWILFGVYAACFGIELTVNNFAVLYFVDYFPEFQSMEPTSAQWYAGLIASLFGGMNLFARTLGGVFGDRFGGRWGLRGRVVWLFIALFCQGLALMLFSQMGVLLLAVPSLLVFSLFVQMAEGATFSVVPFVNKRALGAVSGIVGAGGNMGAVLAGLLFLGFIPWPIALLILGICVVGISGAALAIRFAPEAEHEARRAFAVASAKSSKPASLPQPQLEPEPLPA